MTDRIDDLERRLAAVEKLVSERPATPRTDSRFWALDALREHVGDGTGAVLFTGSWLPANGGPEYAAEPAAQDGVHWQYGLAIDDILERRWSETAGAFAALGHPVRLDLLKQVLTGTTSTKELAETEGLGTSGQLHHHLRTLVAAGWLRQRQRGDYEVPGARIIPLLALLTATLD